MLFYSWEFYLMGIILLPGLIFATYAQTLVTTRFKKFSKVIAKTEITACDLIRQLLDGCGLQHIKIVHTSGHLSDHYNPKNGEIALSNSVYNSNSIAALGIACHELGHALQKEKNYLPYRFRSFLIPVCNAASSLLWPLVIIGLMFDFIILNTTLGNISIWAGVAFFGISVLLNLVTLPVEFDASRRAIQLLRVTGTLDEEELKGTKSVLSAAALTYVAALLVSILNFLRFVFYILLNRSRD